LAHKRDFYDVLSVTRSAGEDEIKSAYRKAALKYHPDRNPADKPHAEEKFREATEAYSILSDPQKRAAYDRFGLAGVSGGGFEQTGFDRSIFEEFSDIFGDFFGVDDLFGGGSPRGGRRRSRAHRGSDLRYDMTLSFEEAANGMQSKIKIPRTELCESCKGSGAKQGTSAIACQTCGGHGQVHYQQGFFTITRTCPSCQGAGQIVREPCKACQGDGRVERERTLEIRIPPGVDSQTRLRITGEGEQGSNGGPPGDLYVILEVREHPFFERRNSDLYCTIPVNFAQAALGADISVPTLAGEENLHIPEGTQTSSIFRLKGKGLPDPNSGTKGDLYVNIRVVTPAKLTREQKRLLQELGQSLPEESRPAQRNSSIFEKVKDIFG
jgi:molecular chaperone DnaJ